MRRPPVSDAVLRWLWVAVLLYATVGLLALLAEGCDTDAPRDPPRAPVVARWRPGALPLDVRVAPELSRAERAAIVAAVAYLEAIAPRPLFRVRAASPGDPALDGLTPYGVVVVTSGPQARPGAVESGWITTVQGQPGAMHSAEIRLTSASVRAAAHGLGHALGLGEIEADGALMSRRHDGDAWRLADDDLREVVPTGPL